MKKMKNQKLPVGYSVRKRYTGRIYPWYIVYQGTRHVADCTSRRVAVAVAQKDAKS
jgi:hypothetical protein